MLEIESSDFTRGGYIPVEYTCEGADISPPLMWQGVPASAKSLALIIDDPDAPDPAAPQMVWAHWLVYNIPPDVDGLEASPATNGLPVGAEQGMNDWHKCTYGGPCPPVGLHRYFHKLYALDTVLTGLHNPSMAQLETAMKGHIIEQAKLVGMYKKRGQVD